MEPCYAGALRLAAARGDVKAMQALADGAPRFHPDADHEGFTALHAAAVEGKTREWLPLVISAAADVIQRTSNMRLSSARWQRVATLSCPAGMWLCQASADVSTCADTAGETTAATCVRQQHTWVVYYPQ
jgi:type II secretory pathway component PulL